MKFLIRFNMNTKADAIMEQVVDVKAWSSFTGYGLLPAIEKAEYINKTEAILGSQIYVLNKDGTSHIETISEWKIGESFSLEFSNLPKPLTLLCKQFIERWRFKETNGNCLVEREFELIPTSIFTAPVLFFIGTLLKKASLEHLKSLQRLSAKI